jgi:hypothetical protein
MEIELNYNKAIFFKDLGWRVHILRQNGFFNNGTIEEIKPEFLLLQDDRKGLIPIFFVEVVDIEKWEDKEK